MRSVGVTSRSTVWLGGKKLSRIMLIVGAVVLALIVVGLVSFLLVQDVMAFGTFPAGSSVVGVDVSGLTRTEAIEKCRTDLAATANKPLTVTIDDEKYQVSAEAIGLKLEYEKMVDEAYQRAWSVNILERMGRRFINRPKKVNASLMSASDQAKVAAFVDTTMEAINRSPHDAYIDVTSGAAVIVPARDGRKADKAQVLAAASKALGTQSRSVVVKAERTPAALTDAVFGKLIIVNLADHNLTLYNRDKALVQFPIACGTSEYPTPIGQWKIIGKEKNPSWRNPGSAWAASMPPSIPPGPSNPLGTRAMPLSASGVLIHGTPSPWSIGTSASHGCIRMYIKDAEALFEMVEVNMPVYIVRGPGDPGFDVTKNPNWMR